MLTPAKLQLGGRQNRPSSVYGSPVLPMDGTEENVRAAPAANLLYNARKQRERKAQILKSRMNQLNTELEACKAQDDNGVSRMFNDATLFYAAKSTSALCRVSMDQFHDSLVNIESILSQDETIPQTPDDIRIDKAYEVELLDRQKILDEMISNLARCEAALPVPKAQNQSPQPRTAILAKPQIKSPPVLEADVDLSTFKTWRACFNDWATATGIVNEDRERYVAHLRALMSVKMRAALEHAIGVDASSQLGVKEILDALYQHIRANRNVAIDRVEFEKRTQRPKESFNDYYIDLRKLSQNAAVPNCCLEDRLITRLMAGCHDSEVREKLMQKADGLQLEEAVEIARSVEASKKSASAIVGGSEVYVKAISSSKSKYKPRPTGARPKQSPKVVAASPPPAPPTPQQKKQSPNSSQKSTGCPKCGFKTHVTQSGQCPALNSACGKCGKIGHFAFVCQAKPGPNGKYLRAISVRRATRDDASPMIDVRVFSNGQFQAQTSGFPDTAAEVCLAGPDFLEEINWPGGQINLTPPSEQIFAANNSQFLVLGSLNVELQYMGRNSFVEVFIVNEPSKLIISLKACKDLAIVPPNFPLPMGGPCVRKVSKTTARKVDISQLGEIPESPTDDDISRIQSKFLELFSDVFCETELKTMKCEPYRIELMPGAVPLKITTARQIPIALKDDVKAEIDDMLKQKIIAPVTQSTDWCHPICCVPKPDGKLRFCVDLRALNKWVKRPVHPLTTPIQAVQSVPADAQWFSTVDARKGYWQLLLTKESQLLTTFLTPWGRFCFLRAPMGLNATGDIYCREGDAALAGISNVTKVVDDILVATASFGENVARTLEVLNRCRQHKMTLHPRKLVFGRKELGFVGFLLSDKGVRSDPDKVRAIADFPIPENLTQLRSFLGMVGALPTCSSQISTLIGPLRELRKSSNAYQWLPEHSEAFEALKSHIVNSDTVLALFDPARPTRLETDASRLHGLGFVLRQLHDNEWRIVQCGSRFLTDAESRYAVIELELLALVWATKKLHVYLFGLECYDVFLDHAPLVPILNKYSLNAIENPRLLRLREKIQSYNFIAYHIKGRDNFISDALSRAPVREAHPGEEEGEEKSDDRTFVRAVLTRSMARATNSEQPSSVDSNLDWVRNETANDEACTLIRLAIKKGFPRSVRQVHPLIQPFWGVRNELSESEGLILRNGIQIVIPSAIRKEIMSRLHSSHQGINGTRRRARKSVYWPGLNSDITSTVAACVECQQYLPSQAQEPMMSDAIPSAPFVEVSTDLFTESGQSFLVLTDIYSGWPLVHKWHNDPSSR